MGMDIKKGLNGKVKVRGGDNGDPTKMTEREFAVASLVQRAMKGAMAAIKLVLKLDREAESAERAAARAFDREPAEKVRMDRGASNGPSGVRGSDEAD